MKFLIDYFTQLFCTHAFEYDEQFYKETDSFGGYKTGIRVSVTCKHCAYHKSYWKF
jgi:hypothetical protein